MPALPVCCDQTPLVHAPRGQRWCVLLLLLVKGMPLDNSG
jgi:hypothetical protein